MDPAAHFSFTLTPVQSFVWLTTAGILGVLLSVPMRQHFVIDEKLTFADGVAAGETLIVLDSRGEEAKTAGRSMAAGGVVAAVLFAHREGRGPLGKVSFRRPGV